MTLSKRHSGQVFDNSIYCEGLCSLAGDQGAAVSLAAKQVRERLVAEPRLWERVEEVKNRFIKLSKT